jgi:oligo-1,6-glucosidase
VWHYYRRLVELRGANDVLVYGDYEMLDPAHEDLWAYTRRLGDDQVLVVLNFAAYPVTFEPPTSTMGCPAEVLVSNYETDSTAVESYEARPYEARVYRLL